ncbi:hypothetical protein [Chitinophaga sp. GbtcB8]|uniref:hypothetical protein n=1 Tax=Chitinophaga sp. GbtcB8 TaxID=2824753 RepID=UPI001C2F71BE|nr:hypothetical protein [Chitinophaga sp. GbtcB8]
MPDTFTIYDRFYFIIYISCLLLSLRARAGNVPGLLFLRLVLCCGLVTEITVEVLQYYQINSNAPYYFYLPMEYVLLTLFYTRNMRRRPAGNWMYASILVYLGCCLLFGSLPRITNFPSVIYEISCLLNTVWITLLFLSMPHAGGLPVTRHPMFWIYTALLVFFSCTFYFNAVYAYYLTKNAIVAGQLRNYINNGLNFFLYLTLSYAFICSRRMKKY